MRQQQREALFKPGRFVFRQQRLTRKVLPAEFRMKSDDAPAMRVSSDHPPRAACAPSPTPGILLSCPLPRGVQLGTRADRTLAASNVGAHGRPDYRPARAQLGSGQHVATALFCSVRQPDRHVDGYDCTGRCCNKHIREGFEQLRSRRVWTRPTVAKRDHPAAAAAVNASDHRVAPARV